MNIDLRPVQGAIIGDIAGQPFEGAKIKGDSFETAIVSSFAKYFENLHLSLPLNIKPSDFPLFEMPNQRFSDDTVLTLATLYSLKNNIQKEICYKLFANLYSEAGYGKYFKEWSKNLDLKATNNSFGNGAAMRISPIACYGYCNGLSLNQTALMAEEYSIPTHGHEDGISGAKAITKAIYMAMQKLDKEEIKDYIEDNYNYNLNITILEHREDMPIFSSDAFVTVPIAIRAFLEGNSLENVIRIAISYGGDTDTIASMSGAIAAAYYGVPQELWHKAQTFLDDNLLSIFN